LTRKNTKDELRTTTFIGSRYYSRTKNVISERPVSGLDYPRSVKNRRLDRSRASRKSRRRRAETSSDSPAVSKITPKIGH